MIQKKFNPKSTPLDLLDRLYRLYDEAVKGFDHACEAGCALCCTCNVTLTRLETAYIFSRMDDKEVREMRDRMDKNRPSRVFRPVLTTNAFAKACISGRDVPEEENDPAWGACPLIRDNLCTIYDARPFGCRNMVSQTSCQNQGYARMHPFVLTLNNIFLQYIENLDADGFSGNFSDMVDLFCRKFETGTRDPAQLALENMGGFDTKKLFIRNQRIPALMIPPEHRRDAVPILKQISAITAGG